PSVGLSPHHHQHATQVAEDSTCRYPALLHGGHLPVPHPRSAGMARRSGGQHVDQGAHQEDHRGEARRSEPRKQQPMTVRSAMNELEAHPVVASINLETTLHGIENLQYLCHGLARYSGWWLDHDAM